MSIEITARHMQLRDDIQEYAREKVEAICEAFPRIEHAHVILDKEKHHRIAEIVVQAKNHVRIGSKESADSFRAAIDACLDKAERQLRRSRDKIQDHKPAMRHGEKAKTRGGVEE